MKVIHLWLFFLRWIEIDLEEIGIKTYGIAICPPWVTKEEVLTKYRYWELWRHESNNSR